MPVFAIEICDLYEGGVVVIAAPNADRASELADPVADKRGYWKGEMRQLTTLTHDGPEGVLYTY